LGESRLGKPACNRDGLYADGRRCGLVELLPRHRRQFRRIARNHPVEPPRGPASDAASESISAWDPRDVESLARIAERGAQDQQTYSILERMLSSQSHLLGAIDFFWLTGWVLMGLVVIVWFARPPFGAAKMAPAE
jgi:hypothetical protein